MTSPAEHAATARAEMLRQWAVAQTRSLTELPDGSLSEEPPPVAALAIAVAADVAALAARADELERELPLRLARIFENEGMQDFFARVAAGYEEYERKIEAVEARADELERERLDFINRANDQHERAERAEAALRPFITAGGGRRLEIGRHVAIEVRVTDAQYEAARAALGEQPQ